MRIKRLTYIVYALLAVSCFACSEQDLTGWLFSDTLYNFNIDKEEIKLDMFGGSESIEITTNMEWHAETDADWIKLIRYEGKSTGMLEFEYDTNNSYDSRTGTVSIYCFGWLKQTIKVTQGSLSFDIDDTDLIFNADKESKEIKIETNGEWSIKCDAEWIHFSKNNGLGNDSIIVTADELMSVVDRTTTISVTDQAGIIWDIKVIQKGKYLKVDISDITFNSGKDSKDIQITSDGEWSIKCDAEWIHFSKNNGTGDASIIVTADELMSAVDRTTTIYVTSIFGKECDIKVIQKGKYLRADKSDITFNYNLETEITIETDGVLIWECSEWLSCRYNKGVLHVIASSYVNSQPRYGYIKFGLRGVDNLEPLNIRICQEPVKNNVCDLGLSVKWATVNLGADTPSEYGDYYAWGETTTKSSYTVSNSSWYGVPYTELRSRNVIDSNGNLTPQYDAATQNWGAPWRLPTHNEIEELINKCKWVWTSEGGHYGYRVTGPNGNSIFLPAAGYRDGSNHYNDGSHGYCWCATYQSNASYAYNLYFNPSRFSSTAGYRSYGRPIRPVTK